MSSFFDSAYRKSCLANASAVPVYWFRYVVHVSDYVVDARNYGHTNYSLAWALSWKHRICSRPTARRNEPAGGSFVYVRLLIAFRVKDSHYGCRIEIGRAHV